MLKDILFKTDEFMFSYRAGGILIHNDKILLQKPQNDDGYSVPGGHVSFGELTTETLIREFKEEINADVKIEKLILVGENFFPWGDRPCQQISLYYTVSLLDITQVPLDGTFKAFDDRGNERVDLDFCWIPLSELNSVTVYPTNIKDDLINIPEHVKHFVYKEETLRKNITI